MDSKELDFMDAEMLRSRAEKQLIENQKQKASPEEEADVKRLLHQLQVHQIELEMQNEELRRAYETAENALKRYTLLFDLSPMGYFILDAEGAICELNFRGAEILGERRFSLIDSNFKLFVSEGSKPVFNNFHRKVFNSNAKESCEVLLAYDKNPMRFVYIEGVVIDTDKKCLLSVVDISKFNLQNKS